MNYKSIKILIFLVLGIMVFGLTKVDAANVNFTLSVWLRPEASVASKAILVKDNEIRLVATSSAKALCQIHNGTAWQTAVTSNSALSLNSWQHLECTYDGSELKVFIDGMEQGRQAMTADVQNTTNPLLLAKDASGTYGYFQGIADDVRIYNYARSQDEIALDYNAGLAVKLGGSPGTTTPAVHQWRFEEGSGSTVADSRGLTPTFQSYDWVRPITVTNSTSTLTDYQVSVDLTSADSLVDGLVGSWHMNASTSGNASGTTIVDSSGNSNNGTAYSPNGTGMQWTTGVETGALSFDGVDDYVNISDSASLDISGALTIEAWVKHTAATTEFIVSKRVQGGDDAYELAADGSGMLILAVYIGNTRYAHTGSTTVLPNSWTYVVGVYDGSYLKVYVNGVEEGTALAVSGNIDITTDPVRIGWGYNNGFAWDGTIDEPRIYNRALSPDEIKKSYCIGAKRLYDAGTWSKEKYQSAGCGGPTSAASYDWRDLRFADINNTNLSYWLESDKKAWVKVPTLLGNSNSTIYMYYGNPSATSASNGANTFEFFDDFNRADSTTVGNGWTELESESTKIQIVSNRIRTTHDGTIYKAYSGTNIVVEHKFEHAGSPASSQIGALILGGNTGNHVYASGFGWLHSHGENLLRLYDNTGVDTSQALTLSSDITYNLEMIIKSDYSTEVRIWQDGTSRPSSATATGSAQTPTASGSNIRLGSAAGLTDVNYADLLRLRKYASPEPVVKVGSSEIGVGRAVGQVNLTLSAGSGGANTSVSAMWTTSGKYGSALEFDGTDDYAYTSSALIGSSQFSYSLWFKPNQLPSSMTSGQYLFSQGTDDPSVCLGKYFSGGCWAKKRTITLSPATPQANYQVKVELTPSNFDYSKVQSDLDDLRFTDTSDNLLDFWIETATTTATSTIWVEVAATSTDSIYMYYGNQGASSASQLFSVTFTYKGSSVTYGMVRSSNNWWLDRNLGASQVATAYNDSNAYGDLFQWGRLDDSHQTRTSNTTITLSSTDNPGHSNFIYGMGSPYDWRSPQNDLLWQGVSGTNNPCPSGWRIPTETELDTERASWSQQNYNGAYASPLKLTAGGYRDYSTALLSSVGSFGGCWSSTVSGTSARYLRFSSTAAYMTSYYRASGFSVRCVKDLPSPEPTASVGSEQSASQIRVIADATEKLKLPEARPLADTDWHHMEVTSDGTTLKLYLDGVLENSAAYTGSSANAVLYLGAEDSSPNYGFNGLIDDFRIYSYARDADDVLVDYNAGLGIKLGGSPATTTPATHQWRLNEGTGSTVADSRKMDVSLFGNYSNVRPITITNSTSTLTNYQVSVDLTSADSLVDGLVGSWHMNASTSGNASGTTIVDSSGNSNNGTAYSPNGTGMQWTTGVETGALSFDGTDDYVLVTSPSNIPVGKTPRTVTVWFKSNGSSSSYYSIVSWGGAVQHHAFRCFLGYGELWIASWGGGDTVETVVNTYNDNQWHFAAFIFNGTTLTINVDGGAEIVSASGSNINTDSSNLMIGKDVPDNSYNFPGTIDEVRIYNRAVSAEEIKKSYCIGAKRLYDAGTWSKEKYQSANCGSYIGQTSASYDWRDLRFSDINNTNLNYWLESDKKAWVKVPTLIGNSNSTIYMYYGNPSASSASNGANTFEFFDDFDTDLFTDVGTLFGVDTVDSRLEFFSDRNTPNDLSYRNVSIGSGDNFEVKFKMNIHQESGNTAPVVFFGVSDTALQYTSTNNGFGVYMQTDATPLPVFYLTKMESSVQTNTAGYTGAHDTTYIAKLRRSGTNIVLEIWDSTATTLLFTVTQTITAVAYTNFKVADYDGDEAGGRTCSGWVDTPFVRKYASPEPTVKVGAVKPSEAVGQVNLTLSAGSGGANTSASQMWTTGIYGNGIEFDGTDDYLSAGNIGNVQTLSFWLAPFSLTQKVLEITATDNSTSTVELSNGKIDLEGTGWSSPKLYINGAEIGLDSNLQSVSTINAYEWYHIEVVNGADISASATNFGKVGSNYFTGLMDEIMSYDYSRTPDQVLIDYNAGLGIHFR